jgi:hypothetical protein
VLQLYAIVREARETGRNLSFVNKVIEGLSQNVRNYLDGDHAVLAADYNRCCELVRNHSAHALIDRMASRKIEETVSSLDASSSSFAQLFKERRAARKEEPQDQD